MHGVGLLEGEEVHAGGVYGVGVSLDSQVEEKPQNTNIPGQVVPSLAEGVGRGGGHVSFICQGEAGVEGVLVQLRQLLKRNCSWNRQVVRRRCRLEVGVIGDLRGLRRMRLLRNRMGRRLGLMLGWRRLDCGLRLGAGGLGLERGMGLGGGEGERRMWEV